MDIPKLYLTSVMIKLIENKLNKLILSSPWTHF